MGNFAESHSLPTFKERKAAKLANGGRKLYRWMEADELVSLIYVDLANGATKSEVIEKLGKCAYEGQRNPIKKRTATDYLKAALERMKYDFESKAEELRADLYSKLTTVYADAIQNGDRYNAVQALNSIMKLTGVGLDKQQTNIQLNANKEGVVINFGFKKEQETNED